MRRSGPPGYLSSVELVFEDDFKGYMQTEYEYVKIGLLADTEMKLKTSGSGNVSVTLCNTHRYLLIYGT